MLLANGTYRDQCTIQSVIYSMYGFIIVCMKSAPRELGERVEKGGHTHRPFANEARVWPNVTRDSSVSERRKLAQIFARNGDHTYAKTDRVQCMVLARTRSHFIFIQYSVTLLVL